jgi:hypothetical protein
MLSLWLSKTPPLQVATTLGCLKLQRHAKYPLSKRVIEAITHKDAPIATDRDLRWLSTHCELQLTLQMRHHLGDDGAYKALQRAEELHILIEKPAPLLMGRALHALSISPGPHMGQILKKVYSLQLDGKIHTPEQALQMAKLLLSQ